METFCLFVCCLKSSNEQDSRDRFSHLQLSEVAERILHKNGYVCTKITNTFTSTLHEAILQLIFDVPRDTQLSISGNVRCRVVSCLRLLRQFPSLLHQVTSQSERYFVFEQYMRVDCHGHVTNTLKSVSAS